MESTMHLHGMFSYPMQVQTTLLSWQLTSSSMELQWLTQGPHHYQIPEAPNTAQKVWPKWACMRKLHPPPWASMRNLAYFSPKGCENWVYSPCHSQKHCSHHRALCWIETAKSRKKNKPTGSRYLVVFSFTGLQRDHSFLYHIYSAFCWCYPGELFSYLCSAHRLIFHSVLYRFPFLKKISLLILTLKSSFFKNFSYPPMRFFCTVLTFSFFSISVF